MSSNHDTIEVSPEDLLRERIKELKCLYGISDLVERHENDLDSILQGIVEMIPISWQYPEITCARIIFGEKIYSSPGFTDTSWEQHADIKLKERKIGSVAVYYLEEREFSDEGPFLKEERWLIDAIAGRIGRISERIKTQEQLETERIALNNMNIALKEVLVKVQDEKQEVAESIQANVDKVIMPILFALERDAAVEQRGYLSLLKKNLQDVAAPLTNNISKAFASLTPVEIQIVNMIKGGLSSKEIAALRHIAPPTVNRHRENIRRKLGITNKAINLTTYLNTFMN